MTYRTTATARENGIIILYLPPHTSHALQPLDVRMFAPLKKPWKEILKKWFCESRLQSISKTVFPSLLKQEAVETPSVSIEGDEVSAVSEAVVSPLKELPLAILSTLLPSASSNTKLAWKSSKAKRKHVQAITGEVLVADMQPIVTKNMKSVE
ncbi:hypothetical protein AVEN_110817-1 [Araneus ventricosus]|uniref:DDE-1 domain-containing protein n=1 Tax=Araneus ventricosus TaxID=182803 RepID=A0A4Y2GDV3_ARAVE|nr:hypothetical protein AVEN_110817-1 [Araneus ventricosus]